MPALQVDDPRTAQRPRRGSGGEDAPTWLVWVVGVVLTVSVALDVIYELLR